VAERLLAVFLPGDERDSVLGDLEEAFRERVSSGRRATLWYWRQALAFSLWFTIQRVREVRAPSTSDLEMTMTAWTRDLRLAARSLARRPGFTVVAVLILALGIGANTAIYSVIHGSLLRALPYPEADRLLFMSDYWIETGGWGSSQVYLNVRDLEAASTRLEGIAAYATQSVNLANEEAPERVLAAVVDPDFFGILGLRPVVGRDFTADDNLPGNESVAILGHDLWMDGYGGDPGVVGGTVRVNSEPYTILGVASPDVEILGGPQVFIPFGWGGREDLSRGQRSVYSIGRLAPGATVEAAREELAALFAGIAERFPDSNRGWSMDARTFREWMTARSERSLLIIGGAALLVLVIALVNVANLVLVRAESRQREIAVRLALGAGKGRLLPFFLSEGLLLSLMGGAMGALGAWWGVKGLVALYGAALPGAEHIGLNTPALGVGLLLSVLAGVVVGLVPAARVDTRILQREIREGGRGASQGSTRLRSILIVAEFALAVMLVSGAGLLVNSFWHLNQVELGLDSPERVVTFGLALPSAGYPNGAARTPFAEELTARIGRLGGVEAVGVTSRLPLWGGTNITTLAARGAPETVAHFVELRYVDAGFFDALGVPLLAGRMFRPADYADSIPGVLITRELGRQLFPEGGAVGRSLDWLSEDGVEVLGVVGDIRDTGLTSEYPPGFYLPLGPRRTPSAMIVTVRAAGDPMAVVPGIRDIVRSIDSEIPVHSVELLSEAADRRLNTRRFAMSLLAAFAGLALVLGAVGIYGVMSYGVTQRTRELGVRIALGAHRSDVVRMVLRQGVATAAVGVVLGIGAGLASGRVLESQLYGVEFTDPLTYVAVAGILVVVAAAASWLPARRASSVDPLEALRHE
jgi:predicted permease